jgi:hypothetical protein
MGTGMALPSTAVIQTPITLRALSSALRSAAALSSSSHHKRQRTDLTRPRWSECLVPQVRVLLLDANLGDDSRGTRETGIMGG